jgi:hypothetical protein
MRVQGPSTVLRAVSMSNGFWDSRSQGFECIGQPPSPRGLRRARKGMAQGARINLGLGIKC